MVAMCNDGGIVKNIETSRKPAAKHPKSKDEGSTTIPLWSRRKCAEAK